MNVFVAFSVPYLGILLFAILFLTLAVTGWGAMWMIYVVVRHEERPLRYGLLALVPFASIWYYLGRVRKTSIIGSIPTNAGNPRPSGRAFVIAVVLFTVAFWVVLGNYAPDTDYVLALILVISPVMTQAVGQMWMDYTAVQQFVGCR